MITFTVRGKPVPQGSKNQFGGESSKFLKPWRDSVTAEAADVMFLGHHQMMLGPVVVTVVFWMPRPKSHYRTGAHAAELRPDAPAWVKTKPDVDKLVRALGDALTNAGVVRDDCQIASLAARKQYADGPPSMHVTVEELVHA